MSMNKEDNAITTIEHWSGETGVVNKSLERNKGFTQTFERLLPKNPEWSVLEIGACPGGILLDLSLTHGYHPHALDYLPAVQELKKGFSENGINNLVVYQEDFLNCDLKVKHNVVMSFGFIEHFNSPSYVLQKHWDFVEDGGYLVLGVPVFGPMQLLLRKLVLKNDKYEWSMKSHNQDIMGLDPILEISKNFEGIEEVVFGSYTGNMDMWYSPKQPFIRKSSLWVFALWKLIAFIPKLFNWSSRFFSPYCLVVLRKKVNP